MKDRKEEILKKNCIGKDVFIADKSTRLISEESVLLSMEQYAEEIAVGFANYVLNNVSKSFYDSSINITTNNDYYKQYLESVK